VIAHQDDEVMYAGLLNRLNSRGNLSILWVTNGDGLAPMVNQPPAEYGAMREAESLRSANAIGVPESRVQMLHYSEIEIYDMFVELAIPNGDRPKAFQLYRAIADNVYDKIKAFDPDSIWTDAFQGGHPEHDLAHIVTAKALQKLRRETGKDLPLYELPEYEYTILISGRFRPWWKNPVHEILLTDEEVKVKMDVITCYPSQQELFEKFRRVFDRTGKIARLIGKGFTAEDFLRKEVFGKVPEFRDYSAHPQFAEWATYMFDKNKNVKIRFDKCIRPIAEDLFNS
jgi:LmbE family N-acetylglucosaminyl deacetylase